MSAVVLLSMPVTQFLSNDLEQPKGLLSRVSTSSRRNRWRRAHHQGSGSAKECILSCGGCSTRGIALRQMTAGAPDVHAPRRGCDRRTAMTPKERTIGVAAARFKQAPRAYATQPPPWPCDPLMVVGRLGPGRSARLAAVARWCRNAGGRRMRHGANARPGARTALLP